MIWQCPGKVFCGQPVSFAWAPDGKRVAFSLDEIGGQSTYVGLHVVNVVSGRDAQIPPEAPKTMSGGAWVPYMEKMNDRVGCWPATDLGVVAGWLESRLSLRQAGAHPPGLAGDAPYQRAQTDGIWAHDGSDKHVAFWPSWSPDGTRLAYATGLLRPTKKTEIYTIALDGSQRQLVATGGHRPPRGPEGPDGSPTRRGAAFASSLRQART